jgi:hypothetical protein
LGATGVYDFRTSHGIQVASLIRVRAISAQPGTVILEGVCLRVVLKRLRLKAFRHVYVKALSEHGVWSDEAECKLHEAIDVFLQKEREAMSAMERFLGAATTDTSSALDLPLFREDVIRYHASWLPSKRADFVFLRHPVMPNHAVERTGHTTGVFPCGCP